MSGSSSRSGDDLEPVEWARGEADEAELLAGLEEEYDSEVAGACVARLRKAIEGEPVITGDLRRASNELEVPLTGLQHRIKSPDSIARKVHNGWESRPTATAEQIALDLGDVLRYTFVIDDVEGFYAAAERICRKLAEAGYVVEKATDSFGRRTRYKGVHAAVRAPDGETTLEVQFHTTESAEARRQTYALYRTYRDADKERDERFRAAVQIAEVTSGVPDPPNRPDALGGVVIEVKEYPLHADLR
ncbi:MAG: hypothetical protein HYU28_07740 [Actinobacteria bacterium]|nr:hypothetical protein [Actinomycetota bacterium]